MDGQFEAKISMVTAQMSIYLSQDPAVEGGADTTIRAFIDGGAHIKAGGWFFEIATEDGHFRADEIILSDATGAQNIFTGKMAELPPSIYFIPTGWKTYSHCPVESRPTAKLGRLVLEFGGDGKEIRCAMADGRKAAAKITAGMHAKLEGDEKASVIWGAQEIETDELYVCASCKVDGADFGPSIIVNKVGAREFLLLQKKDKPNVEIQVSRADVKKPVDQKNCLVAKPEGFDLEFTVFYFVPKQGRAKIELFDMFGLKKMDVIDENAAEGAYEIRVDGHSLPPGPYSVRYSLEGKRLSQTSVTRKFDRLFFK